MDNSIEKKRIEGEEDLISTIKVATAALPLIFTIAEKLSKQHGFIHDSVPARFGDKTGRLVWDYILYNEITFDSEDGKIISLFTSLSDAETKKRWDVLVVADGLFCREIDGLFCRSSPDIIVRRRCVLSHKRRGWLQPSPSFRYSRNLALQDELYHPVINNGPAVLVCVDKRLGTGPVNQSRDAG